MQRYRLRALEGDRHLLHIERLCTEIRKDARQKMKLGKIGEYVNDFLKKMRTKILRQYRRDRQLPEIIEALNNYSTDHLGQLLAKLRRKGNWPLGQNFMDLLEVAITNE